MVKLKIKILKLILLLAFNNHNIIKNQILIKLEIKKIKCNKDHLIKLIT